MARDIIQKTLSRFPTARRLLVLLKTSNYTISRFETGALFHNTGASGTVTFTLPSSALIGDYFDFVSTAVTKYLRIDPPATHSIIIDGLVQAPGEDIFNSGVPGDSIRLVYIATGRWAAINENGQWVNQSSSSSSGLN